MLRLVTNNYRTAAFSAKVFALVSYSSRVALEDSRSAACADVKNRHPRKGTKFGVMLLIMNAI